MWWLVWVGLSSAAAPELCTQTADLKRTSEVPLPVRAVWPAGDGELPVIVFSHGVHSSREAYRPLVEHWARHGYLVVQPTHDDSGPASMATVLDRGLELSLVLDRVPVLVDRDPRLKGRVDLERIGVGGHSFGGHTALLVGGLEMTHPTTGNRARIADPRVDALVVISPAGTDPAVRPDAWDGVVHPTLMVIGSRDVSKRTGKDATWRRQAWSHIREGWLLWIEGADHDYGGIASRIRGRNAEHGAVLRDVTLKFWDATLKADAASSSWLDESRVTAETQGVARIERHQRESQ